MAIGLSYHKLFTIGVDSLMMLKWSHVTDITNMGLFNHHFFTVYLYTNLITTHLELKMYLYTNLTRKCTCTQT